MQTLAEIKAILAEAGLAPRHALGQNFLLDHNLIRKLVDSSAVAAGETVLEVGPGTGVLTEVLLERGCRVVAIELDAGLAAVLRRRLGSRAGFELIEGDCLESKTALNAEAAARLAREDFVLVANLPYGAATPLMLTLLIGFPRCRGMWVTIQREVADRLVAKPRTKEYGPLSVVVGALAEVSRVGALPPECFWPRPEVTSAMVSVVRRTEPLTDDGARLAAFCTGLFSKRRKQLGSVLGRSGVDWPAGVTAENRVEELSVEQIITLGRRTGYAVSR